MPYLAITLAAAVLLSSMPAKAQSALDFYKSRALDLIVGFPPGGGYDLFARPVSRHLGRHLGAGTSVVIRYMPGAGSMLASNHIFTAAPKDGSVLGIVSPTMPLDARLTPAIARFEAAKFNWVGRIAPGHNVAFVWHTAPVNSFADARTTDVTFAGTGVGSTIVIYPSITNNVLGTRFKMILGYKGSADAMLAMERGEVQGHSTSFEIVKTSHPEWITSGKVRFLLQYGATRHPAMSDVPTVIDLARSDAERAVLGAVMTAVEIGRAVLTTPGVPTDRLDALRRSFERMLADPEFVADLRIVSMEVIPATGEALGRIVDDIDRMPPALIEKVKAAYGG